MLTGKQKRYLRSLAVNEKSLFQIGKDGLSDNLINSLNEALKARELVKLNVLKTCEDDIKDISLNIVNECSCQLVQIIGKTIVIYRQSKERIINLP